ncbi:Ataxin-10 [Kickxella alabastrina]|uniref:Ataxin-10 n=1 Tax=Kickxella alabastrina TaxID=61397 RepID=A0ACC1I0X4_9FUNG|nr:Ataxin-10 [Kickxella alabastrina]
MTLDSTAQGTRDIYQKCAEYKQRSPHPSRPHISTTVDPAAWLEIHGLFELLKRDDNTENNDELVPEQCEALGCLCMFVRNAVAMDRANQDAASRAGISEDIRNTIFSMIALELEYPEAMKCATAAAQALSNMVTGNKAQQQKLICDELAPGGRAGAETIFWSLLTSINSQTNMAGLMLLLNSLKGDPDLTKMLCSVKPGLLVARKIGELFGDNEDDESDAKTMLYVMLSQFIEFGCLAQLLADAPSLEMYGLLDALAVYCNENTCAEDRAMVASSSALFKSFGVILKQVHSVLESVWIGADGDGGDSSETSSRVEVSKVVSAHRCTAATLSALGSLTTDCSPETVAMMIEHNVLSQVTSLLGLLNMHLPRIENASALQKSREGGIEEEGSSINRLFMFKRDLICIIGNAAHKNNDAQNLIRDLDGLALVLDHMKIDDNHPFIKEYAVVALRSLLDNNSANQEFVRRMDARGATQTPASALAGIQQADVDADANVHHDHNV